jgi:hypothetical protein
MSTIMKFSLKERVRIQLIFFIFGLTPYTATGILKAGRCWVSRVENRSLFYGKLDLCHLWYAIS